jgi:hypothetical protein
VSRAFHKILPERFVGRLRKRADGNCKGKNKTEDCKDMGSRGARGH